MLRPERMSKVSVTGSKAVMGDVVEAVHDLHLVLVFVKPVDVLEQLLFVEVQDLSHAREYHVRGAVFRADEP